MHQADCNIKHVITGLEWDDIQLHQLIETARLCKASPLSFSAQLQHKSLILLFEKPSFRTRLSFIRAMQYLGGAVIESVSATRKAEEPKDVARVLNGYADAVMVRTHEESALLEMASYLTVPLVNGLSALHHPCQALADLCALRERYGTLKGLTLTYIGDGNNVLHSLLLIAPKVGVRVQYCCPATRQPHPGIVKLAKNAYPMAIESFDTPVDAVSGVHAVYTDVWHSMGMSAVDEDVFSGFQVNEALMAHSDDGVFMHCMPMERGKEVSRTLPDAPCSIVFLQSEYRLYGQMSLLMSVMKA